MSVRHLQGLNPCSGHIKHGDKTCCWTYSGEGDKEQASRENVEEKEEEEAVSRVEMIADQESSFPIFH